MSDAGCARALAVIHSNFELEWQNDKDGQTPFNNYSFKLYGCSELTPDGQKCDFALQGYSDAFNRHYLLAHNFKFRSRLLAQFRAYWCAYCTEDGTRVYMFVKGLKDYFRECYAVK
jgi:hypothetical protein